MARLVARFDWAGPTVSIAWRGPLPRIDAHVDLIDWQSGSAREPKGVADAIVGQLRLRRRAFLPARAPIGLLTHHCVHDEAIWRLLEDMIMVLKDELGGEFLGLPQKFHASLPEAPIDSHRLG